MPNAPLSTPSTNCNVSDTVNTVTVSVFVPFLINNSPGWVIFQKCDGKRNQKIITCVISNGI